MVKFKLSERQEALEKMQQGYRAIGRDTTRIDTELESITKSLQYENKSLKDYIL